MLRNVEIKAIARDLPVIRVKAEAISGTTGEIIHQADTFFHSKAGKFKLRIFEPDRGELIFYERSEESGPKESSYIIVKTTDPHNLKIVLANTCGIKGEIKKIREVFIVGQTRIHLDQVEGLGDFIELEFVMKEGQSREEGDQTLRFLMGNLGILEEDLIVGSYLDIMPDRMEPFS
jgi:predicted adenylyl cyclase CyaB